MVKIVFYLLMISFSSSFFASCLADRRDATENKLKTETKQKPENKNSDLSQPTSDAGTEKTELKPNASSDDPPAKALPENDEVSVSKPELRCGWYSNPTPGNHWIEDKDGEWIIGVQGGFQAEGDYPPEFSDAQWVNTNGNYGYGCACLRVTVNRQEKQILKVVSATARPLSVCRNDPALIEPSE